MKNSYKIFLRSDYPKKDGSIPVYLRVIIDRHHKDYALGISVFDPAKYWDATAREVKRCSFVDMKKINETIHDTEDRAYDILRYFRQKDIPFSISEFDVRFKNPAEIKDSFYAFAEEEIKRLEKPSPETIRSYKSYISKTKKYKPVLKFGEINQNFIEKYRAHMIASGNKLNTYHKALAWLRTICKRAREKGLMYNNPFEHIKLRREPGTREYLTMQDLEKLENLYISGTLKPGVQNALKCFLFFCECGLRFRDAKKLKHCDIHKEIYNGKPTLMIRIMQNKTGNAVSIPVTDKAIKLIEEGFKQQTAMKVTSNDTLNKHLKTISKKAEIEKNITFHVARHTFAVKAISIGIPIEVVSKLLGHTDIKTTQIYAKIPDDVKVSYMERFNTTAPIVQKSA
jgi:site-specific recombinase XerD